MRTKLVGSMLYLRSIDGIEGHGYAGIIGDTIVSGTGPTMRDGQIIDSAFSTWMVKSLPEELCRDSSEEKEDARLSDAFPGCGDTG